MSRFSTKEEVIQYAENAAKIDYEYFLSKGMDLNPFCTDGARSQWKRGFDNKGPRQFESTLDFDTIYQRGKAARKIVDLNK